MQQIKVLKLVTFVIWLQASDEFFLLVVQLSIFLTPTLCLVCMPTVSNLYHLCFGIDLHCLSQANPFGDQQCH